MRHFIQFFYNRFAQGLRPAEARRAFREVVGVEAAKLPEPWHLDRTQAVCLFRAVAALAACGSSLPLASLHNVLLCKAGPAGLPAGRGRRGAM